MSVMPLVWDMDESTAWTFALVAADLTVSTDGVCGETNVSEGPEPSAKTRS